MGEVGRGEVGGEGRVEVGWAGEGAVKIRTILTTAIFAPILNTNSFFGSFSSICIYIFHKGSDYSISFTPTKEQYWREKKEGGGSNTEYIHTYIHVQ